MSSENTNSHKVNKIKVGGFDFEIITLGNSSKIRLSQLFNIGWMSETLWIDLQFEVESALNVRVISMSLLPASFASLDFFKNPTNNQLHLIHEPKLSANESIDHKKRKQEIEELRKLHALSC